VLSGSVILMLTLAIAVASVTLAPTSMVIPVLKTELFAGMIPVTFGAFVSFPTMKIISVSLRLFEVSFAINRIV